ncbi:secretoglobin family 2B member 24-like [Mastomys coucha]|uniref:secretoglobin family 2B member 24-like n=1 Tax=Mastomys coucha TaxID=35658 RepID=UPI0012626973|nr:secretoglobin family 2B member 24-like [Mastomys coucha]
MKGTLLLLALLVTGELGFQTTEACVPFFSAYGSVVSGSKMWLDHEFEAYDATEGEELALEKIQDCYREGGFKTKLTDPKILADSNKCLQLCSVPCVYVLNRNHMRSSEDPGDSERSDLCGLLDQSDCP